jgi:hypothetical protein
MLHLVLLDTLLLMAQHPLFASKPSTSVKEQTLQLEEKYD